jgi:tetratricopeptide (TPR) repeat protein
MPSARATLAILVIAAACHPPASPAPIPDRTALAAEADDLFNAGDLAGAEDRYRHLLELGQDPAQRVEIQRRLAKIAWERGQPEQAIGLLEAALTALDADDPLGADLAYEIAKIDLRAGRIQAARDRFEAIEARFWPAEGGRWGVVWARLRLAAIAIHQARPDDARARLAPFLDDPAYQEQIRAGRAHDLLYVAAFVSIACRELGEPQRAWRLDQRLLDEPAAPELRLVFAAEAANAAWAAGQAAEAEKLLTGLLSPETCARYGKRYQLDDLPGFVDPGLLDQPFAEALIAEWRSKSCPPGGAPADAPLRIRLTLARPADGFDGGE